MTGFQGADTDQLRDHGRLLRDRAQTLTELRERLEPLVLDESAWRGPDADAFRASWSSRTAPLFSSVDEDARRRSDELEQHADEQDLASGEDGGSSGSGSGGEESPSLWDRILGGLDVYNTLQNAFAKAKKVWDTVTDVRTMTRFLNGADNIVELLGGTWMYGKKMTEAAFATSKEYSGLAAKLLGKLGVPTGFGTKKFFGWVDDVAGWAGEAMPFLSKAAPWVGKALPALDVGFGLKQMVYGINSGDTYSAITGGANALGGGLMLAGGALSTTGVGAVVGGPMVAAGAVISGGAALADVGKMVYDNWPAITETASNAWDSVSSGWDGLTGALGF